MRGYLEAFDHYCEVGDWENAREILRHGIEYLGFNVELHELLQIWGFFKEQIHLYTSLVKKVDVQEAYVYYCRLSYILDILGETQQAIDFLQKGLSTVAKLRDAKKVLNIVNHGIMLCLSVAAFDKAICLYELCKDSLYFAEDLALKRAILGNIGIAYIGLGKVDDGIKYHQQSLQLNLKTQTSPEVGKALNNLGHAHLKAKDLSKAQEYLTQAQDIAEEFGEVGLKAVVHKNLAELHQALGEGEVARQYAQQALALATELGIPLKTECDALLAELEKEKG